MAETTDSQEEKDLSGTVATHYNRIEAGSVAQRVQSRIFYLRNFNNWIKSVLISDVIYMLKRRGKDPRTMNVLDLASGKGGDQLKWKKAGVKHVVFADIAAVSVEHSRARYDDIKNRRYYESKDRQTEWPLFTAEFHVADCSKLRLRDVYEDRHIAFNIVSCQFSLHYAFESMSKARRMLQNAAENLAPGGLFFGTIPDANELVRRVRETSMKNVEGEVANSFGNDVYRVTFEKQITARDLFNGSRFPLFGAKYHFELEGVVNCPEFLVYFPLLEELAREYGLKLLLCMPFSDFYKKSIQRNDGRALIGRMQALEPYPPHRKVSLMSPRQESYSVAEKWVKEAGPGPDGRLPVVGTMSEEEWEATTLYLVFMFEKEGETEVKIEPDSKTENIQVKKEGTNWEIEDESGDANIEMKERTNSLEQEEPEMQEENTGTKREITNGEGKEESEEENTETKREITNGEEESEEEEQEHEQEEEEESEEENTEIKREITNGEKEEESEEEEQEQEEEDESEEEEEEDESEEEEEEIPRKKTRYDQAESSS